MPVDRRSFLKVGAATSLAAGPFAGWLNAPAGARPGRAVGELVPVADARDGQVRLHLPEGFRYRSFNPTGTALGDGTIVPGRHDGMGAFAGPGDTVVLVRNHEINGPVGAFGPGSPYDEMAGGGTTTVHVTRHGEVLNSYTSLNGTMMNCSGGIMPWGSWVTCEETVNGPDVGNDFTGGDNTLLTKPHGYVFEVPASADATAGQSSREPVTSAGRFAHEAVSFDPAEGLLYLTEDNFGAASGFYRYRPSGNPMQTGRLDNRGRLQMLAVKGQPNAHLEGHQEPGTTYDVEWVDIDDPDPTFAPGTSNDDAIRAVGDQGRAKGAAYFSRCEGQVFDRGVVYFTATQGGGEPEPGDSDSSGFGNGVGQVWAYDTRAQRLRGVYQSTDRDVLDFPDNVTTSPRGTIVLCEDGDDFNFLRGLTPDGELWSLARNAIPGQEDAEFAGSTFARGLGHPLFVNVQASSGLTFAIWGPWGRVGV